MNLRGTKLITMLLTLNAGAVAAQTTWTAREDLRLGGTNDSRTTLTMVFSIAVGPRGAVYLAERRENLILVFDSTGKPLPSIGRAGQGPGEFRGIGGIGFLGDTLYAADGSSQRVSLFTSAGKFITSHPMATPPLANGFGAAVAYRLFPDGSGLAAPTIDASAIGDRTVTKVPILRIDRTGRILDTAAWHYFTNSQIMLTKGTRRSYSNQFFADNPVVAFALDSSGTALVERRAATSAAQGEFRIVRMNLRGDTLYNRAHRYTPVSLPRRLVDSLVTARARVQTTGENPMFASMTEAEQALRAALYLPRFKIPVAAAQFSEDGTLWLRRDSADDPVQQWDVFSTAGDRFASISLPRRINVRLIRRDQIWALSVDDNDVPMIVRYRIAR